VPTHWNFGQFSILVGAPAAYLRQMPAPLAGISMQYRQVHHPIGYRARMVAAGNQYQVVIGHGLQATRRAACSAKATMKVSGDQPSDSARAISAACVSGASPPAGGSVSRLVGKE